MREYETVFITQPNLPESQQKQLVDRLTSLIEKNDGKLFYARNMGKRALAYIIKKQSKGIYTCLDYASKGQAVGDIERNLKLDENVLRFLTIVRKEEVDVEARTAEIAAKGEDVSAEMPEHTIDEVHMRENTMDESTVENSLMDEVSVTSEKEE